VLTAFLFVGIMADFPYWRHFPKDRTAEQLDLSTLAVGALHRLCDRSWYSQQTGFIPQDHTIRAKWMRLEGQTAAGAWKELEPLLRPVASGGWEIPWLIAEHTQLLERRSQLTKASHLALKARGYKHIRHRPKGNQTVVGHDNQTGDGDGNGIGTTSGGIVKGRNGDHPTSEEATVYGATIGLPAAECAKMVDYYTTNGWRVGKNPMKDWQAALRNWKRNWQERGGPVSSIRGIVPAEKPLSPWDINQRLDAIRKELKDCPAGERYGKLLEEQNRLKRLQTGVQ
jgi:hypothetical protein